MNAPRLRAWSHRVALCAAALLCASAAFAVAPNDRLDALRLTLPSASSVEAANLDPAWRSFELATGTGWDVTLNRATGLPTRAVAARYDAAEAASIVPAGLSDPLSRASLLSVDAVDRMSRSLYETLRAAYPALPSNESLSPLAIEKKGNVWFVIYQQTQDGLPIEGARLDLRFSSDGHLLTFGQSLIPGELPSARPVLAISDALDAANDALVAGGLDRSTLHAAADAGMLQPGRDLPESRVAAGPDRSNHLAWIPLYNAEGTSVEARLVYIVRTEVSEPNARFISTVDASTGEVLARENELLYAAYLGSSDADVQLEKPQDPFVVRDLPDLRITVAGVGETFTDVNGDFSLTSPDNNPRQLTSALTGRYAHIVDATGAEPALSINATPGTPVLVHWNDLSSQFSERDSYYHVNIVHSWVKQVDPTFTGLDYEMNVNVNINDVCNAFWDPTAQSVNFFKSGGGCTNSGQIADVIYHEYGHGDNQFAMAPVGPTGGEHEGFADYHAATITDQPIIGRGFYTGGGSLRTCDNNRQYPMPECGGEPHCEGEVIAGALWHMRVNLVNAIGHAAGVTLSDHLFHDALYGRQTTYEGFYFDVLALDDNNGSLADGTPHDDQIIAAFRQHNIGPGYTFNILHTPLSDSESTSQPYQVKAVFSSPATLVADSCGVYYSTGPIGGPMTHGPDRINMTPTGNIREFSALIPAQPLGTEVRYFVKGRTSSPTIDATAPVGAPANQYVFRVAIDTTSPVIVHTPLADKCSAAWPAGITAQVTDNLGVANVKVEWKINGANQTDLSMVEGDTHQYASTFTGTVTDGQTITYRIKATDGAAVPNITFSPSSGFNTFAITHNFTENADHGAQDMTHAAGSVGRPDGWHLETFRNHTPAGTASWKCGGIGAANYLDSTDGVLVTPSIRLGAGASLSFYHWIAAENDANNTAWDGAVVELSTNEGTSWSAITPIGGYTHTIIDNPASPFPAGMPCWSGFFDWRQAQFDLASFAGKTVRVRFRFGADGAVNYEGWYVDDVVLDPGSGTVDVPQIAGLPLKSGLVNAAPNPFQPSTQITFAVAGHASPVDLDIVDVAGRKVRSLVGASVEPGYHSIVWDGRSDQGRAVSGGVYFARLRVGKDESTAKLLRIR